MYNVERAIDDKTVERYFNDKVRVGNEGVTVFRRNMTDRTSGIRTMRMRIKIQRGN